MCVLIFWPIFFRAVSLTVVEAAAAVVLAQLPAHTRPSGPSAHPPIWTLPWPPGTRIARLSSVLGICALCKTNFFHYFLCVAAAAGASLLLLLLLLLLVVFIYGLFLFSFFYFLVSYPSPDQTRPAHARDQVQSPDVNKSQLQSFDNAPQSLLQQPKPPPKIGSAKGKFMSQPRAKWQRTNCRDTEENTQTTSRVNAGESLQAER